MPAATFDAIAERTKTKRRNLRRFVDELRGHLGQTDAAVPRHDQRIAQ